MEKLDSIKRNSSKKDTSKRPFFFSLFTPRLCEVGLENSTFGVGIVDNQEKQSLKMYIGIARAFHRLSLRSTNVFL